MKDVGETLPIAVAHRAFGHLLRERAWPRDPVAVFEALVDAAATTREPRELSEAARRAIVPLQLRRDGIARLRPLIVAPEFEAELARMWTPDGGLAPDPRTAVHVREAILRHAADRACAPHAIVVTAPLRPLLAEFVERTTPGVAVYAYAELPPELLSSRVRSSRLLRRLSRPEPAGPPPEADRGRVAMMRRPLRRSLIAVEHRKGEPVHGGVNPLPAEAEALVERIEALLAQAEPLLAQAGGDEAGYALRETERRYLPDTLKAYLDVPPARRDATADTMLLEQLRLLERATAHRLSLLSESVRSALSANGAFLAERFGPLETLPPAPEVIDPATAAPTTLVRRMLEKLQADAGGDPHALVERAGMQLAAAFPTVASVKRGGFLGNGRVEAVWLDVPRAGGDLLRYMLQATSRGGVEATVTRYLRGIKNKTLSVDVSEWARGLIDDLGAYVERERGARETLTRLFREAR